MPSLSPSPSQSLLIALSRRSLGLCRALLDALLPWPDQQQQQHRHHPQVVAVKAAQLTSRGDGKVILGLLWRFASLLYVCVRVCE